MSNLHNRAELQDRIYTLMAVAAVPFAGLLLIDAFRAGIGQSEVLDPLDWIAKLALGAVVIWLIVLVFRKFRTGAAGSSEIESYNGMLVLKSAGVSWAATFVLLIQLFDRVFGSNGLLGLEEISLTHSGEMVAAFMLLVYSITYFSLNLADGRSYNREECA